MNVSILPGGVVCQDSELFLRHRSGDCPDAQAHGAVGIQCGLIRGANAIRFIVVLEVCFQRAIPLVNSPSNSVDSDLARLRMQGPNGRAWGQAGRPQF
jgi:hypothetical protein